MGAEAAQQLGGLHILVNSGSAPGGSATATGPIETVVDEDLLQDLNVKYVGTLRCSRAIITFMKTAGWGHRGTGRCYSAGPAGLRCVRERNRSPSSSPRLLTRKALLGRSWAMRQSSNGPSCRHHANA
jgi:NAD(P)-dependent dehydrogenase (short-subunit alcohol dehydrogenase family)